MLEDYISLCLPTAAYDVLLWILKVDHSSKEQGC